VRDDVFILREVRTSWGDYGHMLRQGMSAHLRRRAGVIHLERCGPFMPPITLPGVGDIVVPNSTRRQIELGWIDGDHLAIGGQGQDRQK
jgi:hypothetical protein